MSEHCSLTRHLLISGITGRVEGETERGREGWREREGWRGRGGERGRANQTNQLCPHLSIGSTGRESKMKLSGNVLGCVPLTTCSTADGGRRQKGGVQGKLWRHKVTKPRTEPHQGWSCGVRILSTTSPVLVKPAVFSFSYLLRQHPKHSLLSAVLCTERKATNAPICRVYSILIKKKNNFYFMHTFCRHVCLCSMCPPQRPEEGTGCPRRLTGGSELSHGCW